VSKGRGVTIPSPEDGNIQFPKCCSQKFLKFLTADKVQIPSDSGYTSSSEPIRVCFLVSFHKIVAVHIFDILFSTRILRVLRVFESNLVRISNAGNMKCQSSAEDYRVKGVVICTALLLLVVSHIFTKLILSNKDTFF
jgi:hypothetical protein